MSVDNIHKYTTEYWKRRFKQQAETSKEYRHKLYEEVDLKNKMKILDVGCGTGAITFDIAQITKGEVIGIDVDSEKLEVAKKALSDVSNILLIEADTTNLPFENDTFDLVVFTLVIMFIKDQQKALNEIARVTKSGGIVLATLEPDYATVINYPDDPFREVFIKYLTKLDADIYAGRKLRVLFNTAGLQTTIGIDTKTEFLLINDDKMRLKIFEEYFWSIEKILKDNGWKDEGIRKYKQEKIIQIKNGLSFDFLPAFYAIGRKK
jgi:ubiquinone/menaquinone biosynthesis C-methylase UbiE